MSRLVDRKNISFLDLRIAIVRHTFDVFIASVPSYFGDLFSCLTRPAVNIAVNKIDI